MSDRKDQGSAVAVLVSGGVESAAMLTEALSRYERVYPIYVRKGLQWEMAERVYLRRLLGSMRADGLAPATVLNVPLEPIYGHHWSLGKSGTPDFRAPDDAVYLPGRNVLLLSLGGLFCSSRKVPTLWIGILKGNPFRDARAGFLKQIESILSDALNFPLRIATPMKELTKAEVITRWPDIRWEKTFSCLRPVNRRHCGRCQKCAERKTAFKAAGVPDPTLYGRRTS